MGNALSLGGFCFSVIGACFVAWGIWRAWTRSPQEWHRPDTPVVDLTTRRQPGGWSVRGELARLFLTEDVVMSRSAAGVPITDQNQTERRSEATEPHRNSVEQGAGTMFGTVVTYLERCDDDQLLAVLAELIDDTGDWRFAESRVAKFIPGRVEDRLAQVRAIRDTVPPPPEARQLRVRDDHGERLIPMT